MEWSRFHSSKEKQVPSKILMSLFLFTALYSWASSSPNDDRWKGWQFLIGDWVAEGSGKPGEGSGEFSFEFKLEEKVIVRKNRAEYPATQTRPASSHEDLMIIYRDDVKNQMRAVYFDTEGHVINYAARLSHDSRVLTFLSDSEPLQSRFRLSYTMNENGTLKGKF